MAGLLRPIRTNRLVPPCRGVAWNFQAMLPPSSHVERFFTSSGWTRRLSVGMGRTSRLLTRVSTQSSNNYLQTGSLFIPVRQFQNGVDGAPPAGQEDEAASLNRDGHHYGVAEDDLFHLLCNKDRLVPASSLLKALRKAGLWRNDPRLAETMNALKRHLAIPKMRNPKDDVTDDVMLDEYKFGECVKNNIVLIKRALTGDFVIPEFPKFRSLIDGIYADCRTNHKGTLAAHIPQLAKYNPDYWGVSLCTIDGQRHSIGDVDVPFTLQSVCKSLNYALAVHELGVDVVHDFVGHEPRGESFETIKLSSTKKPHNPLINAGAILIASLIRRELKSSERFEYIQTQYKRMGGNEFLAFNNSMFLFDRENAYRNYALAHYMQENNCFPVGANLDETLNFYFQMCAIEVNANSAAVMAATLANGGFCPITGEEILNATSVRNTLSLMHSCGMYDQSGGFAFTVGLPAKSSISGAVIVVVPNVMGLCLWSPPLDRLRNSVRGVQFCQQLVKTFNFHHFDNLHHSTKQKRDPRIRRPDLHGDSVVNLLFGAYNGDFTALRRMSMTGQDMSIADYDGRTSLHLTASEGHLDCVRFLVENCNVPVHPRDRWGHTPLDDAIKFNHKDVQKYLEECEEEQRY